MGTAHLSLSSLSLLFLLFGSVMIWVCAWVQSESRHYREKQMNKREHIEKRRYFADWMTKSSPNALSLTVCFTKVHEWIKLCSPELKGHCDQLNYLKKFRSPTMDGSVIECSHLTPIESMLSEWYRFCFAIRWSLVRSY